MTRPGTYLPTVVRCQVNDRELDGVLVLCRLLIAFGHLQDFRHDGIEGAQPGLGLSVVEVEGAGGVSWVQDPNPLPLVFLEFRRFIYFLRFARVGTLNSLLAGKIIAGSYLPKNIKIDDF